VRDPLAHPSVRRVPSQVRLIDVMPTLLDSAGVPLPAEIDGRSLVPLMAGSERDERLLYAEVSDPDLAQLRRIAVRKGGWKLIVNLPPLPPDEAPSELYHVADDPLELRDLSGLEPARKDAFLDQLRVQREAIDRSGRSRLGLEANVPADVRDRLRALGYVQ
jgi:arylsulfatase A-like enzyme